jgi:hypothetical protein
VVEGTLSIYGCLVTALINPGSAHSFVNETRACHLDWARKDLPYELHVSIPLGRSVVASRYIPDYDIQVGREVLKRDLILMATEDYDLILGMDWLSKHGARVNCKNMVVQFVRPRRDVLEFKANQLRSRSS